jgi:prolyl oligopeptidase
MMININRLKLLVSFSLFFEILGCASKVPTMDELGESEGYTHLEERKNPKVLDWVNSENSKSLDKIGRGSEFDSKKKIIAKILDAKSTIPKFEVIDGDLYTVFRPKSSSRGQWRKASLKSASISDPSKWEVVLDFDKLSAAESKKLSFDSAVCLKPAEKVCLILISIDGGDNTEVREFDLVQKKFVPNGFNFKKSFHNVAWIDKDHVALNANFGEGTLTKMGLGNQLRIVGRGQDPIDLKPLLKVPDDYMFVSTETFNNGSEPLTIAYQYHSTIKFQPWILRFGKAIKIPIPEGASIHGIIGGYLVVSLPVNWQNFKVGDIVGIKVSTIGSEISNIKKELKLIYRLKDQEFFNGKIAVLKNFVAIGTLKNVRGQIPLVKFSQGSFFEEKGAKFPEMHLQILESSFNSDSLFYSSEDFLNPKQIYKIDLKNKKQSLIFFQKELFNSKGMVSKQLYAKSKDGTMVPYFVVGLKSVLEKGNASTLLDGYGAYGISMLPAYSGIYGKLWLEKGGIFALANVRGGGELGFDWHMQATKKNKQKSIDDFIAVSKDLIERKLSSPKKLGIYSGSMGGIIVGGAMTQAPQLYSAAVAVVPALDLLRSIMLTVGNWRGELGDPENDSERLSLIKISPFHNLKAGVKYPSLFIYTTASDERIHPAQGRKMVAKLLDLGNKDTFLYEASDGGHGGSATNQQEAQWRSMMMEFLATRTGLSDSNK